MAKRNWARAIALVTAVCSGSSLAVLSSASLQTGCSKNNCAGTACADALTVHVPLLSPPDAGVLTIVVCRNDQCINGQLTIPSPGLSVGESTQSVSFPDSDVYQSTESDLAAAAITSTSASTAVLDVSVRPYSMSTLHDGDRYTVTLTDSDGELLVSVDQTVKYTLPITVSSGCNDEMCRHADIIVGDAGP